MYLTGFPPKTLNVRKYSHATCDSFAPVIGGVDLSRLSDGAGPPGNIDGLTYLHSLYELVHLYNQRIPHFVTKSHLSVVHAIQS